jgi:hypothetical protein
LDRRELYELQLFLSQLLVIVLFLSVEHFALFSPFSATPLPYSSPASAAPLPALGFAFFPFLPAIGLLQARIIPGYKSMCIKIYIYLYCAFAI